MTWRTCSDAHDGGTGRKTAWFEPGNWPVVRENGSDGVDRDGSEGFVSAVATGVSALVLVVAFGLLAADVAWFWVAFPVGYGGALPLAIAWARRVSSRRAQTDGAVDEGADATDETVDRMAALREAYVAGEVDEAEFERELERVMLDDDRSWR